MSQIQDNVDGAFESFKKLYNQISRSSDTITSEEDVRLKVINPFFVEVLGWDPSCIQTEEPTGEGFLDYKFNIDGSARLVVEAKNDSLSFGLEGRTGGRAYKLNGPILSVKPLPRDGILQAISYCGAKNAELACISNGREWVVFRGSRLGDGKDTLSGMAFVFPSLESVKENFKIFFDLLGRERVEGYIYRALFQEAEGQPIRAAAFSRTVRPVDGFRLLEKTSLAQDIDRIMSAFFRNISGDDDPEMLAECFVTTKESQIADEKLARITDDLSGAIRDLDTDEAIGLQQIISKVKETNRNEFVLLVGTKGAGKSTFIDRFFRYILPPKIRKECVVSRVDVGKSTGEISTLTDWLNRTILELLEKELFDEYGPSYDEIQGMFFDEYMRRRRGPLKHLYEDDKLEFKKQFGEYVENLRNKNTKLYIERVIRSIVTSRRKVPCLVFDNTDHFSIDYQEFVFQYARSIYQNELCLVIIPITDKTSWQLSQQGALQSFDNESFFLPTPLPKTIVERRIAFLDRYLSCERKEKGTGYFVGKGIHLSLDDLKAFVTSLQHIFLETGMVSKWIGNLANNDIRRCLSLSRDIVSSPYLKVDDLIKAFVAGDSKRISEVDIQRAIIRRGYNYYPTGVNQFVQNIFALNNELQSTPLLALRLLRLLRDAKHHDAGGLEDYVTIEQILDYAQGIGIERRPTLLCLDVMLKTGLCFSYDPTIREIDSAKKIQLSPSGLQHLHWGSWEESYLYSMLQVTPIADESTYERIRSYKDEKVKVRWRKELVEFIDYLLKEDSIYVHEIEHPAYGGQQKIRRSLEIKKDRLHKNNAIKRIAR
jgi:energy-coupling factor transporter ATP-binding protein EcfA2